MMNYHQKDVIIGKKWLVLSKIGEGSFGEIFKAKEIGTNRYYAIKREPIDIDYPQLHHESTIYDVLKGGPCIPKCHWFGRYEIYNCIIIDLLGSSLKDFQQAIRHIPLDIVVDIGCQLVSCLEFIHDQGLLYRDIKPENFLFSSSIPPPYESNEGTNPHRPSYATLLQDWHQQDTLLYAIDFGLATAWRNPKTNKPYPESKKLNKYKTGTARYASLNVHRGHQHARRDDMESLGYLILDLLVSGELPWSGVTARSCKAGWDRLRSIKEEISLEDLCLGLPRGILCFIDYTRRLRFMDRPDYDYLRQLLRGCLEGPGSEIVTAQANSRMIPSPPRYTHFQSKQKKPIRRASIHLPQSKLTHHEPDHYKYQHQHEQYKYSNEPQSEDVFIMDDLLKELPKTSPSPPYQKKYMRHNYNDNYKKFYPHKNSFLGYQHYVQNTNIKE